ncbi:hypothetical protein RUND412_001145 [Rhizina undulata]
MARFRSQVTNPVTSHIPSIPTHVSITGLPSITSVPIETDNGTTIQHSASHHADLTTLLTDTATPTNVINATVPVSTKSPLTTTSIATGHYTSTKSSSTRVTTEGSSTRVTTESSSIRVTTESSSTRETSIPVETMSTTLEPQTTTREKPTTTSTSTIIPASSGVAATDIWFSSSLVVAPSPTTTSTASGSESASTTAPVETGISSSLPQIITPPGGIPSAPANSVLVRFGFTFKLNYQFVSEHPVSVAQIFEYLPEGIVYGLDLDSTQVVMHSLQPYDTSADKGYITTLANAYIPSNMYNTLSADIHIPSSKLFTSPDEAVNEMMAIIDPTIPLLSGLSDSSGYVSGVTTGSSSSGDGSSGSSGNGGSSDAAPVGMDQSTGTVSKKTVGIGIGVVGGAAVYGAAMFFVARRYRNKRGRHARANSMDRSLSPGSNPAGALMSSGGAMMHGARTPLGGDKRGSRGSGGKASARTQNISGPVMAENSLGWN